MHIHKYGFLCRQVAMTAEFGQVVSSKACLQHLLALQRQLVMRCLCLQVCCEMQSYNTGSPVP